MNHAMKSKEQEQEKYVCVSTYFMYLGRYQHMVPYIIGTILKDYVSAHSPQHFHVETRVS